MANRVSHSSTAGATTKPPSCQCSTRTARCSRRRRRSGSVCSTSTSTSSPFFPTAAAASHSRRSPPTMSLRAGLMTVLVAGAVAQPAQNQPELIPQPAAIELAAAPASSPTIPSWTTTDVEKELQLGPDDLHAPMTVTHFTRQLDLVVRDPNVISRASGTRLARGDAGAAVAAQPAGDSGSSSSDSSSSSSSSDSSSPSSTSSSSDSSSTSSTSDSASSPLPSPFDDSPTSIFKSSSSTSDACPAFMKKLLDDPTFKKCYPLSMMLRVC